ncbi:MAG: ArsR/SmtB family transcription factor [Angustibacter sp.]
MDPFTALADDTRREIVRLLAVGEQSAGELSAHFAVSRPAVSRHLRVLREAGVVNVEPRGTHRVYALRPEALADVEDWLAEVRGSWSQRLDALETEVRRGRRQGSAARPDPTAPPSTETEEQP